jgi:hypothetical protein
MAVRQIKNEKVTSLENLDKQLVARQAGVKTVPVENVSDGFQPGETIETQQKPDYKGRNVEKNAG